MVILSFCAFFPITKEISQNTKKNKKKRSRDGVKRRRTVATERSGDGKKHPE